MVKEEIGLGLSKRIRVSFHTNTKRLKVLTHSYLARMGIDNTLGASGNNLVSMFVWTEKTKVNAVEDQHRVFSFTPLNNDTSASALV